MKNELFDIKPLTNRKVQWCKEDRPDYKLVAHGCGFLSDSELLSIVIGEINSLDLSRSILSACGHNLNSLGKMSVTDLKRLGLTESKAKILYACFEMGRRRRLTDSADVIQIKCSRDVRDIMHPLVGDIAHEEFWILYLNRSNKVIAQKQVSKGGISGTVTDVRIIMKQAIELLASGIICCHNHPSGNLQPSESDTKITQKIKEAGSLMDIQLLDHIIIADKDYYSFADNGLC